MTLRDLLTQVVPLEILGDLERDIDHLCQDSRQAGPGSLFVAIRGARVDGHDYAPRVRAAAALVEREIEVPAGVTTVRVADTRAALAAVAAAFYGHPSRRLKLAGITGTNGKTTTARWLESIASAAGLSVGVIGTVGHRVGGRDEPAAFTTPEAPRWQALLAEMADAGCAVVAAEVSSIGLAAKRVDATRFAAAAFTNLSRDHLDFHGDMARYAAAKARLFRELLPAGARAVINADDVAGEGMLGGREDLLVWTYGLSGGADVRVEGLTLTAAGSRGRLITPMGAAPLRLQLVGRHNVYNALAAAGLGLAVGAPLAAVAEGLAALEVVPGRLEPVAGPPGAPAVFVDYAHTDDALRHVLSALRELTPGRLVVVFGCGGDRDRGKRPLMARAATEGADVVVATSDNPRGEDPAAILDEMRPGLSPDALVEPDRAAAIRMGVAAAGAGDVVLIAGKGHEQYQEVRGARLPFDDRRAAAAALEAR